MAAAPAIRNAADLARFVLAHPALLEPLRTVAALGLPDAWIGAGFLRDAVWDALHGLPFGTNPPSDVDVVWFDPARATAAADAAIEAQLRAARPAVPWEVRNQARMAARNGHAPYAGTLDAMAHWPDTATAVAARLNPAGGAAAAVEVAAPWGVDDLLAGLVRPTPAFANDPARATAAADAAIEARLRATHPDVPWSVRNQARMATCHGDAPYADTLDAMAHWTDTATAVAARLGPGGAVEVAAPWGVDDLLAGVVRPTPACAADPARREAFARRIASKEWLRRWPGLRVLQHPPPG